MAARTIDLSAARTALEQGDSTTFDQVAVELGLDLRLGLLLAYVRRWETEYAPVVAHALLEMAATALREPSQFGFGQWSTSRALLAVKLGDRLVMAMQPCKQSTPFPKSGWKMGRWYKDPARNRPTVEAWASDPARDADALTAAITRDGDPFAATADDTRGAALLAAVVARPEDDAARLVYADWLSEQGDMRGELIRVQCELESGALDDERRSALRDREQALLAQQRTILAPITSFAEDGTIRRGLIEGVTIRVVKLAKYGAELVTQHPIRRLHILANGPTELARLGTLPYLARIPELAIEARRTPKILQSRAVLGLGAMATSEIWAGTRTLSLAFVDDDDLEWTRWFSTLVAPKLETLSLVQPGFSPEVLVQLANAPGIPALRRVRIDYPLFHGRGVAALTPSFEALARRGLASFTFASWHVGDVAIAPCVAALAQHGIEDLELTNCTLGGRTVKALAGATKLRRLSLSSNTRWGDLTRLASTVRNLPALRELELEESVGAEAVEALTHAIVDARMLESVTWRNNVLTEPQRARISAVRELRE